MKSCYNCKAHPVCKITQEMGSILRTLRYLTEYDIDKDLYKLIGSKCELYTKTEDSDE